MNKIEKKYSEIEYIKRFLSKSDKYNICDFCKYNIYNYKTRNKTFIEYSLSKCKYCIHKAINADIYKNKIHLSDNFKPLYHWEEEKKDE